MAIDVTPLIDRHATNRWEWVCIGDLAGHPLRLPRSS
jgi:hypothetical protein